MFTLLRYIKYGVAPWDQEKLLKTIWGYYAVPKVPISRRYCNCNQSSLHRATGTADDILPSHVCDSWIVNAKKTGTEIRIELPLILERNRI